MLNQNCLKKKCNSWNCRTDFQLGGPQNVLVPGVYPPWVQTFVLHLVELHKILVYLPLQMAKVLLDGSMVLL